MLILKTHFGWPVSFLQNTHIMTRLFEIVGGRKTTQAGADDEDVERNERSPSEEIAVYGSLRKR